MGAIFCKFWIGFEKKHILNIKLADQFFFLSKFDLIPWRFFFISDIHKYSIYEYVYQTKIPSYPQFSEKKYNRDKKISSSEQL